MKTYEEMAEDVLRRRDDYRRNQKKRQKGLAVVCALCLLTVAAGAAGETLPEFMPTDDISNDQAVSDVVSLSMESRLFLSANGQQTILEDGISLPKAYALVVHDIRGMSKAEAEAVYQAELAEAEKIVFAETDALYHVNVRQRENVVIRTVRLGEFELEVNDPAKVASICGNIATEYGRVEFYADGPGVSKDDYGPYSGESMILDGDSYRLLLQAEKDGTGRLAINWRPTGTLYQAVNDNPNIPLSTFDDTITLCVEYIDGTQEEHIIQICFNDAGEAELCYRSEIPDTIFQEDEG